MHALMSLQVCARCMAETPFYTQLTVFAIACVAKHKIQEAKTAFEECLMLYAVGAFVVC